MVAKGPDWWSQPKNQIGNGPFILKQLSETRTTVFALNPNWRGPKPSAEQLVYRYISEPPEALAASKAGELDVIYLVGFDLGGVRGDPALAKDLVESPGACSSGFSFNLTKPPFDQRDIRLAFAKALDCTAYTHDVLHDQGKPSLSWLVPGIAGYDPNVGEVQKFDPDAARELLAKAGYPNGQGLPEIKFPYINASQRKAMAEFIANQYRQNLGVQLTLEPMEAKDIVALSKDVKTSPAILTTGWCSDYPDPQDWFTTYWRSTAFARTVGYKNEALDKLMDAADAELDPVKRVQIYHQAETIILAQDVAFMPTHQLENYWLIKPYINYGKITSHDVVFWPGWFEPWQLGVKRQSQKRGIIAVRLTIDPQGRDTYATSALATHRGAAQYWLPDDRYQ
jgi:oligopeptide transport system substrate-binding protein